MTLNGTDALADEEFADTEEFVNDLDLEDSDLESFEDDDDLETIGDDELEGEGFGGEIEDEGLDLDEEEAFAERRRRRFPRFRARRRRYRTRRSPRFRRARGRRRARVRTRGGRTMTVSLGKSFATARDLNAFKVETRKAILNARKEAKTNFTRLDGRLNKFTKTLDKKINTVDKDLRSMNRRVKKVEDSSRMSMLMPLIMGNPEIESVKITEDLVKDKYVAASVKYKENDNLMLPLILMSQSGGTGDNNSALLALAMMK